MKISSHDGGSVSFQRAEMLKRRNQDKHFRSFTIDTSFCPLCDARRWWRRSGVGEGGEGFVGPEERGGAASAINSFHLLRLIVLVARRRAHRSDFNYGHSFTHNSFLRPKSAHVKRGHRLDRECGQNWAPIRWPAEINASLPTQTCRSNWVGIR